MIILLFSGEKRRHQIFDPLLPSSLHLLNKQTHPTPD